MYDLLFRYPYNCILPCGALRKILLEVADARQQGFSATDESWFRGSAEDYVQDRLLSQDSPLREYVSQDYVRRVLEEHSTGQSNHRLLIWSLLSFERWVDMFLE